MSQTPPSDWGKDPVSDYIEHANHNTYATFNNLRGIFGHLAEIGKVFDALRGNLDFSQTPLAPSFAIRTYSSYLAGVRLSTSGQIPETYVVLRACLENSLYAHCIHANRELAAAWLNREVDQASQRVVRKEFATGRVLKCLEQLDPETGKIARALYERTITYGAHPNPYSVLTQTRISEDGPRVTESLGYLECGTLPHIQSMKTCAEVGLCCLHVFNRVFPERFQILGLWQAVLHLRDPRFFDQYKKALKQCQQAASQGKGVPEAGA